MDKGMRGGAVSIKQCRGVHGGTLPADLWFRESTYWGCADMAAAVGYISA